MKRLLVILLTLAFVACSSTGANTVKNQPEQKSSIEIIKSLKVGLNDSYSDLVDAYGEGKILKQRSNSKIDVIYYDDLGVSFFIDKTNGNKIINILVD